MWIQPFSRNQTFAEREELDEDARALRDSRYVTITGWDGGCSRMSVTYTQSKHFFSALRTTILSIKALLIGAAHNYTSFNYTHAGNFFSALHTTLTTGASVLPRILAVPGS
jgi:hypothetical protein